MTTKENTPMDIRVLILPIFSMKTITINICPL